MQQTVNRLLQTENIELDDLIKQELVKDIVISTYNKLTIENLNSLLSFDELDIFLRGIISSTFRALCNVPMPVDNNKQVSYNESSDTELNINFTNKSNQFEKVTSFGNTDMLTRSSKRNKSTKVKVGSSDE